MNIQRTYDELYPERLNNIRIFWKKLLLDKIESKLFKFTIKKEISANPTTSIKAIIINITEIR